MFDKDTCGLCTSSGFILSVTTPMHSLLVPGKIDCLVFAQAERPRSYPNWRERKILLRLITISQSIGPSLARLAASSNAGTRVVTRSGTTVSVQIYLDPAYAQLSGVLSSQADMCDLFELLGQDFVLLSNSLAT